jgi:hypothetical protein
MIAAVAVAPAVQAGVVHGFMLGDELVWPCICFFTRLVSARLLLSFF